MQRAVSDLLESCGRVARKARLPTRSGFLGFFGDQVLVNGMGWTAGVLAAELVRRFFDVRGFRNLWGLAAHGRTLVSADEYQLITTLVSYSAGLVMLILVRHLVLRWITEFYGLRFERARAERASDAATGDGAAASG